MNVAHELEILRQIAIDLPEYLLADVLFWPMAGADLPKLSLGMLLLTRIRLFSLADQLAPPQQDQRIAAEKKIDATLAQWRVAAEKKAEQELRSRTSLWQSFWEECRDDPKTCATNYPHEVTQRTIAALLLRAFPRLAETASAQALAIQDRSMRRKLKGDQFIWPPELQRAFPKDDFWFLYSLP